MKNIVTTEHTKQITENAELISVRLCVNLHVLCG